MWVTFGTKQCGQFRQCGRFSEARIREVSLYVSTAISDHVFLHHLLFSSKHTVITGACTALETGTEGRVHMYYPGVRTVQCTHTCV